MEERHRGKGLNQLSRPAMGIGGEISAYGKARSDQGAERVAAAGTNFGRA